MPFYPTDPARARRPQGANALPAQPRPSRDFRPVHRPARPVPYRSPRRRFDPLPPIPKPKPRPLPRAFRPLNPLGVALDYGDFYRRRMLPDSQVLPEGEKGSMAGWFIRHGPNIYGAPYNFPPLNWAQGFIRDPEYGAQTGLIQAQSTGTGANSRPTFSEYILAYPFEWRASWWIPNYQPTLRHANGLTLVKSGAGNVPTHKLAPAINLWPATLPHIVPIINPARFPVAPPARVLPLTYPVIPRLPPLPQWPSQPNENPYQPAYPSVPGRSPVTVPVVDPSNPPAPTEPLPIRPVRPATSIPNVFALETWYDGKGVRTRRGPNRHRQKNPPPRQKEQKARLTKIGYALLNAFGEFTEGLDLMDAAWEALPKDLRSKSFHDGKYVRPNWRTRAADVYNNAAYIDPNQFVRNFVANQIEDTYVGVSSQVWNPPRAGRRPIPNNDTRREIDEKMYENYGAPPIDDWVDSFFDGVEGILGV